MKDLVYSPSKVDMLVKSGADILLSPKGEEAIGVLLDMEDAILKAKEKLKQEIIKRGKAMFPDFHAVKGDKIRMYTKKLERYTAEKTPKATIKEFCKEISFLKLDQDKVSEYVKKNKKIPSGIFEKAETETLIISRKKE